MVVHTLHVENHAVAVNMAQEDEKLEQLTELVWKCNRPYLGQYFHSFGNPLG